MCFSNNYRNGRETIISIPRQQPKDFWTARPAIKIIIDSAS
jgi:hypothetical protein